MCACTNTTSQQTIWIKLSSRVRPKVWKFSQRTSPERGQSQPGRPSWSSGYNNACTFKRFACYLMELRYSSLQMAIPITRTKSSRDYNIDPIGPLDYILDLAHTWNCLWIEKAAPGEAIKVLVYPARDPLAPRIMGLGIRTPNGESLMVSFTTLDGERGAYSLDYQELLHT